MVNSSRAPGNRETLN